MGVKDAKCENRHLSVCVLVVLSCFPSLGPQCCGVYVLDLCVWARFKKSKKNNSMLQSLCVYISGAELEVVRRLFFYPLSVNEQIYTDKWCIVIAYVK